MSPAWDREDGSFWQSALSGAQPPQLPGHRPGRPGAGVWQTLRSHVPVGVVARLRQATGRPEVTPVQLVAAAVHALLTRVRRWH